MTDGRLMTVACAALSGGLAIAVAAAPAMAQSTQLPGLIVTIPPSPQAPKATPAPAAKPKPKPEAKRKSPPRRSTRSASRDPGTGRGSGSGSSSLQISLLVNDDPITNYEIRERAKLLSLSANISDRAKAAFKSISTNPRTTEQLKEILRETIAANQGKSREQIIAIFERRKKAYGAQLQRQALASARASAASGLTSAARDELVEERLKLQEAKRLGITIDDSDVNSLFERVASNNKMTAEQFTKHLNNIGASARSMKERFRANAAWSQVVARKFGRLVSVSQREIDQFIGSQSGGDDVRLRLHKITLSVPDSLNQAAVTGRLGEAEQLRRRFQTCRDTAALATKVSGASFNDLRDVNPDSIGEPTRSMLLSADVNDMLPPSLGQAGIELYAVCDKGSNSTSFEARSEASRRLQLEEMNMLGKRHLADLKRDAHIERR